MLEIVDEIRCLGDHKVKLFFHFSEDVTVTAERDGFALVLGELNLHLVVDPALQTVELESRDPGPGWRSHGYHQLNRITTLVGEAGISGNSRFVTQFVW